MSQGQKLASGMRMLLAMRTRRPLAAYPRGEDPKEIFLDLITTTAVWCADLAEEDAVKIFRDCLRWVRGEAAAEPTPPSTLN